VAQPPGSGAEETTPGRSAAVGLPAHGAWGCLAWVRGASAFGAAGLQSGSGKGMHYAVHTMIQVCQSGHLLQAREILAA